MSKTISIRVSEDLFNGYSNLNQIQKEKFKLKFNELVSKFISSVNSCKQSVNSHSEEISFSQKIKKSIPKGFDVNDFVKEL